MADQLPIVTLKNSKSFQAFRELSQINVEVSDLLLLFTFENDFELHLRAEE